MIKNYMDTSTLPLNQLLFNGRYYKVPKFQRDYSWKQENWEDLWEDIMNIYKILEPAIEYKNFPDVVHYMGSVIFRRTNDPNVFEIIDGQQRLLSLTLIGLAGIKYLKDLIEKNIQPQANEERIKTFERYFIGTKDAFSLFFKNKLELNKNDQAFFKDKILRFQEPIISKLRYSQKLIYKSYKFFYKNIKEIFDNKNDNGAYIAFLLEKVIGDRLIFTQILVEDVLSAYSVFETLNARGIALAPTDLLKNYLFSLIKSDSDLEDLENKWYSIVNIVGFEKFPTFLRYFLNSYRELVRSRNLFKVLREEIDSDEKVLDFLDKLESVAYLYQALNNPADEFWNDFNEKNKIIKHIEALKLFRVTQYIPLIFAIYKHSPELIEPALRMTKIIAFRYAVISNLNTNEMEKIYNKTAMVVEKGKITLPKELFKLISPLYIDDKRFKTNFETVEINTKKNKALVKYILVSIENELSKTNYDYTDSSITIEHIFPEKADEKWLETIKPSEASRILYRLGNLTLLESTLNRKAGNADFKEKKTLYRKSRFLLTKEIAEKYERWSALEINKRQQQLATIASSVWRLDY